MTTALWVLWAANTGLLLLVFLKVRAKASRARRDRNELRQLMREVGRAVEREEGKLR